MQTTQADQTSHAPLAFSLSLRTPGALQVLTSNAINSSSQRVGIVLSTAACSIVCAALLYLWLPLWLCIPLALLAGKPCFRYARDYFEGGYVNGRVQSNRNMLVTAIDAQDVDRFAKVAAEIAASRYAARTWLPKVNARRDEPYLYLATLFSFAPECWSLCSRQVYQRLLAEVSPAS